MTVSTEIAMHPKFTTSRNSDFAVSRGTNSNWDFVFVWICTEEFEFLDLVNFGVVVFSVEAIIYVQLLRHKHVCTPTHEQTCTRPWLSSFLWIHIYMYFPRRKTKINRATKKSYLFAYTFVFLLDLYLDTCNLLESRNWITKTEQTSSCGKKKTLWWLLHVACD